MIELRDYQVRALDALRQGIREGHRAQILCAPTGAGKTVIASRLISDAIGRGTKTAFLADRIVLVDQTSRVLDRYEIPHGVIQAGHWRYRPNDLVQVCSVQTIEKRGFFPGCRLVIVDEAHVTRKVTSELIRNRTDLVVVGLTATPFTRGLGEIYSNVVNVTTTYKLQEEGWLVPLDVYAAKSVDMTGAKTVAGEWSDAEATDRGLRIVGDVLEEWIDKTHKEFGGPVKTICFSASVAHGEEICRQFQAAGFDFRQISYKDANEDRRRALIDEFSKPNSSIVGLVAVDVLTRGFDVPDVLCGISARPYRKSLSQHIQQIGRVLRPAPGKERALWLDHSGNYLRFYEDMDRFFREGVSTLDEKAQLDAKPRKEPDDELRNKVKCPACGYVMPPKADKCPSCGHVKQRRSLVEVVPGQMVKINGKQVPATGQYAWLANRSLVWRQLAYVARKALERKGLGDRVDLMQRRAQAMFRDIYGDWHPGRVENTEAIPPCEELTRKIRRDALVHRKTQTVKGYKVAA